MSQPIELVDWERFWMLVDRRGTDECWLWEGAIDRYGYGNYRRTVNKVKANWIAHRLAYIDRVGPIPEGLVIDHTCRTRACMNTAHMEPVTNAVNLRRGAEARQPTLWTFGIEQYQLGRSLSDIAAELGLHRGTIAYRLKQSGVTLRPRGKSRRVT